MLGNHSLNVIDAIKGNVQVLLTAFRISLTPILDEIGGDTKTTVAAAGSITAAGALQKHDLLLRKLLFYMVGGRKPGKAPTDDDDISLVAASQGFIDSLVLEVGGFEPEIVDKVFVEIGWPQVRAAIVRRREIAHDSS